MTNSNNKETKNVSEEHILHRGITHSAVHVMGLQVVFRAEYFWHAGWSNLEQSDL